MEAYYQVYDFTNKRYLKKQGHNIQWSCFKHEAHRYATREEAEACIAFFKPFTANEFHILTVRRRTPSKAAADLHTTTR